MAEMRPWWGNEETEAVKVIKCRLEWLGHLACMPDHRIPSQLCLGGCLRYVQDVVPEEGERIKLGGI